MNTSAKPLVQKIISGGQTGVDRAALDFALQNKISCGGFCPKGRLAEDGIIPPHYPLNETETAVYEERTELNVMHSDGTLIIAPALPLIGGTLYTFQFAEQKNKPCFICITGSDMKKQKAKFLEWLAENKICTLNIAGPRESTSPGIGEKTKSVLKMLIVE